VTQDPVALTAAVRAGDRAALARAITIVESTRADHRAAASVVLDAVMDATGGSVRVGVSGPPGVGKSSLIEALGLHIVAAGQKLAVLAVDPTSPVTGGSVLGDKTRMEALGRSPDAFIRPSPSGSKAGGVARRTRESLLLCEAGGFDAVIIETVGSGQSDVAVAAMVDVFVLLVQPSSGDDLQGIKRGVMELADVVVVTKADGDLAEAAQRSVADHRAALDLLHPTAAPPVLSCSATEDRGVTDVWDAIRSRQDERRASGALDRHRQRQARDWLWTEVNDLLAERLLADDRVKALAPDVEAAVEAGTISPTSGALRLIEGFGSP
jgi:LAO/AO transport system kinase